MAKKPQKKKAAPKKTIKATTPPGTWDVFTPFHVEIVEVEVPEEILFVATEPTVAATEDFPDELLIVVPPDLSPPLQEDLFQQEESPRTKRWKRKRDEEETPKEESVASSKADPKAESTPLEVE